jgi:hypothetical protein
MPRAAVAVPQDEAGIAETSAPTTRERSSRPVPREVQPRRPRPRPTLAPPPPPGPLEPAGRETAARPRARSAQPSGAQGTPDRAPARGPQEGRETADRSLAPGVDAGGVPGRRTVTIRGRGAERDLTWTAQQSRRRPAVPTHERPGFRPDRAAMWAVLLGLLLVLVAATSSHAAVLVHALH